MERPEQLPLPVLPPGVAALSSGSQLNPGAAPAALTGPRPAPGQLPTAGQNSHMGSLLFPSLRP